MVTNSIVSANEEDFARISRIIERDESALGLSDIALLEDYLNILFDCEKESAERIMDVIRTEHPDMPWRLMMSEGEKVMSVYICDGENLTVEDIGKTMDEIALDAEFTCSGNCSSCSSDCSHTHGEGCDCEECQSSEFSLDETVQMFTEMIREGDEEFFSVLTNAFREEMERFTKEQSGDDADETYDLFMNDIAHIILSCAAQDGSYTREKHSLVEKIFGTVDYERMKSFALQITNAEDEAARSMKYWREAQSYGCEIRRYILMMCTYICCAGDELSDSAREYLEALVQA